MSKIEFKAEWTGEIETLDTSNLTEYETKIMLAARNNEYNDCIEYPTWSFTVCENSELPVKSCGGVIASLVKKGYAISGTSGLYPTDDETFGLTDAGKALFNKKEN